MNEPHFEVFPEMSRQTSHDTDAYDETAYHPSGDEYTKGVAHCNACDWETSGDPGDTRDAAAAHEREHPKPTGQFAWHFKDANGRITFTGGEAFTRREDAHRAIRGVCLDVRRQTLQGEAHVLRGPTIVDLDEDGEEIG